MTEFDYIVVGGGSAGAVLAARLAGREGLSVLLLEAGGGARNPLIRMPAGVLAILVSRRLFQWPDYTEPQAFLDQRRLYYPRGRVLGGGSSINGAMWVRGEPAGYDDWNIEGWRYSDVLPYFKKSEACPEGPKEFRGSNGPVKVSRATIENELSHAFVDACKDLGMPENPDFNARTSLGVGSFEFSIRDGVRMSTAESYLSNPTVPKHGLTIVTRARATRVLFEGTRAIGVEARVRGLTKRFRASREVLLCSGAIGTPQLLQLSGVGDADQLQALDLPVVSHAPEVGKNLQDHLQYSVQASCKEPVTLYSIMGPTAQLSALIEWLSRKTGPATNIGVECGGFWPVAGASRPDIQINFMRANLFDHGRGRMKEHGFMAHACHVRPASRGYVGLRSANPLDPPIIEPRFLSEESDRRSLRAGVKLVREIFASSKMRRYTGTELAPGSAALTDADLDAEIRRGAESVWHPAGTCRMGNDDRAVVDADLRVRGISALRVVDASVMPTINAGNTNAPTIMIAEKAADLLLRELA